MVQTGQWRDNCAPVSSLTPRDVARALNGDPLRDGVLAPGPGHSRKDRSLRIWLDPLSVHSFAGDDWRTCDDYVREKLGLGPWQSRATPTPRVARTPSSSDRTPQHQREKARWLWQHSQPARGTPVERYLRSRAINLSELPETLRYIPARPPKYEWPAMIAPFALTREPEPGRLAVSPQTIAGVHLTLLRPDGRGKANIIPDKKIVGPSMGVPVVIASINDGLGLAITEGIEDALSVHLATGLGVWAAGSATRMPALSDAVPDYIDAITIVADGDDAGQRNAELLAHNLVRRAYDVDVQRLHDEWRTAA
jgi:Toprim domain